MQVKSVLQLKLMLAL